MGDYGVAADVVHAVVETDDDDAAAADGAGEASGDSPDCVDVGEGDSAEGGDLRFQR